MRGLAEILTSAVVLLIVVGAAIFLHTWSASLTSTMEAKSSPSIVVPPQLVGTRSDINTETGYTRVCVILQNSEDQNIPLEGAKLLVEEENLLLDAYSPDCGDNIPPNGVCTVCSEYNASVRRATVRLYLPANVPPVQAVVQAPSPPDPAILALSFSNPLSFAPPHPDRYANVLFHGDSNAALFHVTVKNEGLVEAEFNVLVSGPCIQEAKKSVTLAPDEETTLDIETTTTSATPACTVTASIEFPGPEQTTTNNQKSIPVTIFHYFECNTATDCQDDLATARGLTDVNSVVLLTADIQGSYISFPSGDYGWRVTFDGNGHEVNNAGSSYALKLYNVKHVDIRNVNVLAESLALSPIASSISLRDTNVYASSRALYLPNSRISSASNAYCFFSGDPTPYPILSIDEANYDLNISAYLEENAPGSPALCHVSVLADGVKIHDGNVGAERDGKYLSFGAIVVYEANDVNIYRVNASANSYVIYLCCSSISVYESNVSTTTGDAMHLLKSSHIFLFDSTVYAYAPALYLTDSSSASIYNSTLSAGAWALQLNKSSATVANSTIKATSHDAIYLYWHSTATLYDTNISSPSSSIYLDESSSASLYDSNIWAKNRALVVDRSSRISSASNAYCFFSGDPTPYPILSIDEANYDLNISAYLEENAPGSPALCHVSVLADGVKIHDGNVGAERDGKYLSFGAIVVYEANDVNIYRVNASASSRVISLWYSSVAVHDSNIFAPQDAFHIDDYSSATISNSTVSASSGDALYLWRYSSVSLYNSSISAPSRAIYLGTSSATIYDSNIYAEQNYAFSARHPTGLNISLSDGNVYIYSPGYDWYIEEGTLNTHCFDCGTYCLDTNFDDKYESGTIAFDPDANCLTCTCG